MASSCLFPIDMQLENGAQNGMRHLRCKPEVLDDAFDRANPEMVIVQNCDSSAVSEWNVPRLLCQAQA